MEGRTERKKGERREGGREGTKEKTSFDLVPFRTKRECGPS